MITYPNQKVICVHKIPVNNKELYTQINLNAINKALETLSGNAFKLFIYIAKNQNNHKFALSCSDIIKKLNISNKTYYNAFKELISTGYIQQTDEDSNYYIFNEGV
jgi:predicted transcriptional regulator